MNTELFEILEKAIDSFGLTEVLEHMDQICVEKAMHLRTNWQDSISAQSWEHLSNRIHFAAKEAKEYML